MTVQPRQDHHEAPTGPATRTPRFKWLPIAAWSIPLAMIMVVTGAWAGHLLADQLARQQLQLELDAASDRVMARLDDVIAESRQVFGDLGRAGLDRCSTEELLVMRTEVFTARFLRDIGGLDNRILYCSSALGSLDVPYRSGPPDLVIVSGLGLKTDREVMAGEDTRTLVIEGTRYNALVDPAVVTDLAAAMDAAALFLRSRSSAGPSGDWHPFQGTGTPTGHGLSSERCSAASGLCVLLDVPFGSVAGWPEGVRMALSGLGGAAGFAVFLVLFLALRRERSDVQRLHQALRHGHLRAVYQPIVQLPDHRLVGLEALARWHDSNGEAISPEWFIALAEESGLIGAVSEYMIRAIGRDLSDWLVRHPDCLVAINIAPAELDDDRLLDNLDRELIARGIRADQVMLEITERTMVENESARTRIERLSERGFRVYADDFGVGYCGLAYLNDMEVHGIKISHLFTRAVATDSPKAALVPRITELAREMGLNVIIEGVETQAQARALAGLEPIQVQGWRYARGMSAEQVLERFESSMELAPED